MEVDRVEQVRRLNIEPRGAFKREDWPSIDQFLRDNERVLAVRVAVGTDKDGCDGAGRGVAALHQILIGPRNTDQASVPPR